MAVAVLVPWRPGDEHREAAWEWVKDRYASAHPGWQVIEGTPPDGPWVKALAIQDALNQTDADTLVIADADVWADGLDTAVERLSTVAWVMPHGLVHRLDEPSTAAVLAGGPLAGTYTQQPYRGHPGGGITVLSRTTYEQVPMDPRFVGWGQEDNAWELALNICAGRKLRLNRPLWHLWHPPQERLNRIIGSPESSELLRRYRNARTPDQMGALLEEIRRG